MSSSTENNTQSKKKKTKEVSGDGKSLKANRSSLQRLYKKHFENGMVYLYQFKRTPRLPSLSSNCLKVESWLRLTGIHYTNIAHKMAIRGTKAPIPVVELNGEQITDSDVILEQLAYSFGRDLDAALSPQQKSVSHALISMLDNHLAWVVMWWRSKHPARVLKGYQVNLQHVLGTKVPKPILDFFFKSSFKRKNKQKMKAQGMGKHSSDEILEHGKRDLDALENILEDKNFFFGAEPATADVVAFAHLAQIYFIGDNVEYPLRDYLVKHCTNLTSLIIRMKKRCFPDWEAICKNLDLNTHLAIPEVTGES